MANIIDNRRIMHSPAFAEIMAESDQAKGIDAPPHSKAKVGDVITLPPFDESIIKNPSYLELLDTRRSERVYKDEPISREQLAFLLWSTQGIQDFRGHNNVASLRPAPSGGARHPFELYIAVRNVTGLEPGFYRYLPLENVGKKDVAIEYVRPPLEDYQEQMKAMLMGQTWGAHTSVVLFYSCVPYRGEWRYVTASHRLALMDIGHVGQNAMLSAVALGLGSCCIAAYEQKLCDEALGFNGVDEYTVYVIPVGVVKEGK